MKVDLHTHILPRQWPDLAERYGYGGWVSLVHDQNTSAAMFKDGMFFRRVKPNCWDWQARLADMDQHSVDVQVMMIMMTIMNAIRNEWRSSCWSRFSRQCQWCSATGPSLRTRPISVECSTTTSRRQLLNPHLDFPDCVLSLCRYTWYSVYPSPGHPSSNSVLSQDPVRAADEIKRCREELGFHGVQIGSHIGDVNLDDASLTPFYAACERHDMAVFVHPWDMATGTRWSKYWLPWLVGMPAETTQAIACVLMGGVLQRHASLRMCFAHGAGAYPYTCGRLDHGYKVRPDLCATDCDKWVGAQTHVESPELWVALAGRRWISPDVCMPTLWCTMTAHCVSLWKLWERSECVWAQIIPFPSGNWRRGN